MTHYRSKILAGILGIPVEKYSGDDVTDLLFKRLFDIQNCTETDFDLYKYQCRIIGEIIQKHFVPVEVAHNWRSQANKYIVECERLKTLIDEINELTEKILEYKK